MKKRLLLFLLCLCTALTITACGGKEDVEDITKSNDTKVKIDENKDNELIPSANMTATLYSYYSDSYYKVKVDKEKIKIINRAIDDEYANDTDGEKPDLWIDTEDTDTYEKALTDGYLLCQFQCESEEYEAISYNVYSIYDKWRSQIREREHWLSEGRTILPYYEEEWCDNGGVYNYNGIEYTVFYQDDGYLEIYVKNPYIDAYDLLIELRYIGEANADYLKIAEKCIDSVEIVADGLNDSVRVEFDYDEEAAKLTDLYNKVIAYANSSDEEGLRSLFDEESAEYMRENVSLAKNYWNATVEILEIDVYDYVDEIRDGKRGLKASVVFSLSGDRREHFFVKYSDQEEWKFQFTEYDRQNAIGNPKYTVIDYLRSTHQYH